MAKRHATEPLEDVIAADSPASKRARVEDDLDDLGSTNGDRILRGRQNGTKLDRTRAVKENYSEPEDVGAIESDEEEQAENIASRQHAPAEGYQDLYLDTINRAVLDFDFEKLCSVTLSNINVYACLVCGKYYQGRGPKSQAYFHALDEDHHVYINMETKKVYVLPEGYEVISKSLEDIKYVVDPRLPKQDVIELDKTERIAWDLSGQKYIPGFVGMNNIKANDYFNVITHALAHVAPLRNFLMLEDLSQRPQLAQRFSILVRKIWNPRAFKTHVSPHELLQEIALRSSKKFTLTEQSDPVEYLSWFLNNLHIALGGSKTKPGTSIIQKVFQGALKVESQSITKRSENDRMRFEEADVRTETSRFLILTLDLPAAPLFHSEQDENVIPHVPLSTILGKYDGIRAQERLNTRLRYRLLHPLPPYLLFHIKRFSINKFVSERNPTIVTFPAVPTIDLSPFVEPNPALHPPGEPILYDLVANVTHEAVRSRDDSVQVDQQQKVWRVQLRDKARDEWYEVQDLFVEKVRSETLFAKESYVQVWERRKVPRGKNKAKS